MQIYTKGEDWGSPNLKNCSENRSADPPILFYYSILRIGGPAFRANVNWFLWCVGIMSCITCRSSSSSASTSPSPAPCLNSSSLRLVTYLIYNPGILDYFFINRYFILSGFKTLEYEHHAQRESSTSYSRART